MTAALRLLASLVGILILAATAASAQDDRYPSRPVTVIVPFAAGGLSDVPVRVLAAMTVADLKKKIQDLMSPFKKVSDNGVAFWSAMAKIAHEVGGIAGRLRELLVERCGDDGGSRVHIRAKPSDSLA